MTITIAIVYNMVIVRMSRSSNLLVCSCLYNIKQVKVWVMSQTCDQKRFTISKVAADWHELMIPLRIIWHPLPELTIRPTVQPADISLPQPAMLHLYPIARTHSFSAPLRVGG